MDLFVLFKSISLSSILNYLPPVKSSCNILCLKIADAGSHAGNLSTHNASSAKDHGKSSHHKHKHKEKHKHKHKKEKKVKDMLPCVKKDVEGIYWFPLNSLSVTMLQKGLGNPIREKKVKDMLPCVKKDVEGIYWFPLNSLSVTMLQKGQGNPIRVSMIFSPRSGLLSHRCCKSWTWGWDSLVPSAMWWLIIFHPRLSPHFNAIFLPPP